jgi:hypothetical protein
MATTYNWSGYAGTFPEPKPESWSQHEEFRRQAEETAIRELTAIARGGPEEPPVDEPRLQRLLAAVGEVYDAKNPLALDPMTYLHETYREVHKKPPFRRVSDVERNELRRMRRRAAKELKGLGL